MDSSLTDAQRASMASHARAWIDRALTAEPVDWVAWERGVRRCYQVLSLRFPHVVRVPSPLALARALWVADVDEVPGDEDRALVGLIREGLHRRVDDSVERVIGPLAVAQLHRGLREPVRLAVGGDAVAMAVAESVGLGPTRIPPGTWEAARSAAARIPWPPHRRLRGDRVPDRWQSWRLHLGGRWDSDWIAAATFVDTHQRRRAAAIAEAESADWWWPHLNFVLVSHRPTLIRTEEVAGTRRLHAADGPALAWSDGWQLHFWHGTRVPAWVIDGPTVTAIHNEPNVEVRRCAIEVLGWDAYITQTGLRLADTVADPGNPGQRLELYDIPAHLWGEPARVLLATNGSPERDGTRRRYGLPVPADVATALHAAAWTYGLTAQQYAGLARRT